MLTDIYLALDRLCGRKVFRPTKTQSRIDLAAIEGCKTKKCLGALRTLWRSSGDRGHNDRVTHLKSLLMPSPRRERNQNEGEEPVGAVEDDDQGARVEDSENEGPEAEEEPENEGSEQAPENEGSEQEEEGQGEEVESPEEGDDVAATSPEDSSPPSHDDVSPASQDSGSHRNSPTLRLDDCYGDVSDLASEVSSISSEDSMPPDSQVPGAGWMGRAMMAARRLEKQEKEEEEKRARINSIIGDIRTMLFAECHGHDEGADLELSWDSYKGFCLDAIQSYGEDVCHKLATMEFFFKWLREEKAAPAQAGL